MSKPRLIVETTTERVERTVRRVWVDLPGPRPTKAVDVDGEPVDEVSGVHTAQALRPLAKTGSRPAEIVPLFRKAAG